MKKAGAKPAGVRPEGQEKNPLFQDVHDRVQGLLRRVGVVELLVRLLGPGVGLVVAAQDGLDLLGQPRFRPAVFELLLEDDFVFAVAGLGLEREAFDLPSFARPDSDDDFVPVRMPVLDVLQGFDAFVNCRCRFLLAYALCAEDYAVFALENSRMALLSRMSSIQRAPTWKRAMTILFQSSMSSSFTETMLRPSW